MFTVYGRENCPYCVKAKDLLIGKGIQFVYIDILEFEGVYKFDMITAVKASTGKEPKTVPQIFDGGLYVGGFTNLEIYLNPEEDLHIEQFDL